MISFHVVTESHVVWCVFLGGTVDCTAYKITEDKNFKQTYVATGNSLGGTNVDEAFVQFLEKVFGKPVVHILRTDFPGEWLNVEIRDCFFYGQANAARFVIGWNHNR